MLFTKPGPLAVALAASAANAAPLLDEVAGTVGPTVGSVGSTVHPVAEPVGQTLKSTTGALTGGSPHSASASANVDLNVALKSATMVKYAVPNATGPLAAKLGGEVAVIAKEASVTGNIKAELCIEQGLPAIAVSLSDVEAVLNLDASICEATTVSVNLYKPETPFKLSMGELAGLNVNAMIYLDLILDVKEAIKFGGGVYVKLTEESFLKACILTGEILSHDFAGLSVKTLDVEVEVGCTKVQANLQLRVEACADAEADISALNLPVEIGTGLQAAAFVNIAEYVGTFCNSPGCPVGEESYSLHIGAAAEVDVEVTDAKAVNLVPEVSVALLSQPAATICKQDSVTTYATSASYAGYSASASSAYAAVTDYPAHGQVTKTVAYSSECVITTCAAHMANCPASLQGTVTVTQAYPVSTTVCEASETPMATYMPTWAPAAIASNYGSGAVALETCSEERTATAVAYKAAATGSRHAGHGKDRGYAARPAVTPAAGSNKGYATSQGETGYRGQAAAGHYEAAGSAHGYAAGSQGKNAGYEHAAPAYAGVPAEETEECTTEGCNTGSYDTPVAGYEAKRPSQAAGYMAAKPTYETEYPAGESTPADNGYAAATTEIAYPKKAGGYKAGAAAEIDSTTCTDEEVAAYSTPAGQGYAAAPAATTEAAYPSEAAGYKTGAYKSEAVEAESTTCTDEETATATPVGHGYAAAHTHEAAYPAKAAGYKVAKPAGYEAEKPAAYEAEKPKSAKPAGYEAEKPTGYETEKPASYKAAKPAGHEAEKPTGYKVAKPVGYEAEKPKVAKPAGYEAEKPAAYEAEKPAAYKPSKTAAYKPAETSTCTDDETTAYQTPTSKGYAAATPALAYPTLLRRQYSASAPIEYEAATPTGYETEAAETYAPADESCTEVTYQAVATSYAAGKPVAYTQTIVTSYSAEAPKPTYVAGGVTYYQISKAGAPVAVAEEDCSEVTYEAVATSYAAGKPVAYTQTIVTSVNGEAPRPTYVAGAVTYHQVAATGVARAGFSGAAGAGATNVAPVPTTYPAVPYAAVSNGTATVPAGAAAGTGVAYPSSYSTGVVTAGAVKVGGSMFAMAVVGVVAALL